MKVARNDFLQDIHQDFSSLMEETKALISNMDVKSMNTQEAPGKWSVLQCMKHMSIAAQVYVENMEESFQKNSPSNSAVFRSSWRGDMFAKMISPKADGTVKNNMKTFKSMDPKQALDQEATIREFFEVHGKLVMLAEKSKAYDLNRIKVATALGPMVKLRLGDAFRFLLGHSQRHLLQLKRIKLAVMN